MRLIDLKMNQTGEIALVRNKNNPSVKMAEAMGLRKGEKIRLSQVCGRNLVLTMSGVKIIIDKEIAKDIEVI